MAIRLSKAGDSGFTLVELLVVLTIAGLLLFAAPAIVSAARPALVSQAAARALAHEIGAARQIAVAERIQTRVVLNSAANEFITMPGGVIHHLPKDVPFKFHNAEENAGGNEIDFFPDGSSTGGTIVIGNAGHFHCIVAHWLSGRVSLDE